MGRHEFQNGDKVVIRRGVAKGSAAKDLSYNAASSAFKGDVSGCRGAVVGVGVESDGVACATIAVTDNSADGRRTGHLTVPLDRLRHTGGRVSITDGRNERLSGRCIAACATQAARDSWDRVFGKKRELATA